MQTTAIYCAIIFYQILFPRSIELCLIEFVHKISVRIIWIILHFVYWLCASINSCWGKKELCNWAGVGNIRGSNRNSTWVKSWSCNMTLDVTWFHITENNNSIISISDSVSSSPYQTEVWTDSERRRWGSIPQNATISTQQQWYALLQQYTQFKHKKVYTLLQDNNTHNSSTIQNATISTQQQWYTLLPDNTHNTHYSTITVNKKRFSPSPKC